MCGLVGVITNVSMSIKDTELFTQLLYADTLRGTHSTGMACIPSNNKSDIIIHKKAMNGSDFIENYTTAKILNSSNNYRAIIGHNRKATLGAINNRNAHPFQHENITLTHNGSLRNMHNLQPHKNAFSVDSELITHMFSSQGVEESIKKLEGAFALVWHDTKDNTINFLRNKEREFCFALADRGQKIIYASEENMLMWLLERNNYDVSEYVIPDPGEWVQFYLDKFVGKYEVKEVELYTPPVISNTGTRKHNSNINNNNNNVGSKGKEQSYKKEAAEKILEELELELDDQVDFTPYAWSVLNEATGKGILLGVTEDDPFIAVEVFNVSENAIELGTDYTGKVLSARYSPFSAGDSTLILYDVHKADNLDSKSIDGIRRKKDDTKSSEKANKKGSSRKGRALAIVNTEDNKSNTDRYGRTVSLKKPGTPITKFADIPFLSGPSGVSISRQEWLTLVSKGCIQCGGPISEYSHKNVVWLEDNKPMCSTCSNEWQQRGNKIIDTLQ